MKLTVLGSNAAIPGQSTYTSSFVLNSNEQLFLIDAGEGVQQQIRRHGIKFSRIKTILISHLHGDHVLGLPGLLSTLSLLGRTTPIELIGPTGLEAFLTYILEATYSYLTFPLHYTSIDPATANGSKVWEDKHHFINAFAVHHSIPALGFRIEQQPKPRKILVSKLEQYEIPTCDYELLKQGRDLEHNGEIISNEKLTADPAKSKAFGYCTDTRYHEDIVPHIQDVDLLYHEATFDEGHHLLAKKTGHSTQREAAKIATKANAKMLVIGHLSARIKDKKEFLAKAVEIFPNTMLAEQNKVYSA